MQHRAASAEVPLSRCLYRNGLVVMPRSHGPQSSSPRDWCSTPTGQCYRGIPRGPTGRSPAPTGMGQLWDSIRQTRQSAHGTSLWHLTADGSELGRCRVEPPGEHWNPSGANTGIRGFAAHGFLYHGVGYHRIGYHGFAAHGIGYHGAPAWLRVTPGRHPTETPARHPPG